MLPPSRRSFWTLCSSLGGSFKALRPPLRCSFRTLRIPRSPRARFLRRAVLFALFSFGGVAGAGFRGAGGGGAVFAPALLVVGH